MGLLDADEVRAALGERLGDRFLQYAGRPDLGEAGHLLIRIDQHLATVRVGDVALAHRIALACKQLLVRADGAEPDAVRAIVAAARYYVDTFDLSRDDQPDGYVDDALVVDYVLGRVAPDLPRVRP
jgi:hypothetical protein